MKRYKIVIAPIARKQIDKLPPNMKSRIGDIIWNVLSLEPFSGKALKADLKGLYSYRAGDYRIIYAIVRHELIIQIVKVMHRREVYR